MTRYCVTSHFHTQFANFKLCDGDSTDPLLLYILHICINTLCFGIASVLYLQHSHFFGVRIFCLQICMQFIYLLLFAKYGSCRICEVIDKFIFSSAYITVPNSSAVVLLKVNHEQSL